MIYSKIGAIPYHLYIQVDSRFTHEEDCGWQEAMWVGITSIPGRMWGLNVIFREGGMLYRNIPPHAVSFDTNCGRDWAAPQAQLWDCYSYHFTAIENPILKGIGMNAKIGDTIHSGIYLFEVTHLEEGWSNCPEQDKTFYFIQLDNGRLTIQPTNRITFIDDSFIKPLDKLPMLKLSSTINSCE
jgi:hypothetical protein